MNLILCLSEMKLMAVQCRISDGHHQLHLRKALGINMYNISAM